MNRVVFLRWPRLITLIIMDIILIGLFVTMVKYFDKNHILNDTNNISVESTTDNNIETTSDENVSNTSNQSDTTKLRDDVSWVRIQQILLNFIIWITIYILFILMF